MAAAIPSVLVLGHSFVKRLKRDLHSQFDPRAVRSFKGATSRITQLEKAGKFFQVCHS